MAGGGRLDYRASRLQLGLKRTISFETGIPEQPVQSGSWGGRGWKRGGSIIGPKQDTYWTLSGVFITPFWCSRARARAYLLTTGNEAFKCFRLCLKDSVLPPSCRSHYAPFSWPARGSYKTPIRKPSLKGLTTLCPFFLEGCNSRETRDPLADGGIRRDSIFSSW